MWNNRRQQCEFAHNVLVDRRVLAALSGDAVDIFFGLLKGVTEVKTGSQQGRYKKLCVQAIGFRRIFRRGTLLSPVAKEISVPSALMDMAASPPPASRL